MVLLLFCGHSWILPCLSTFGNPLYMFWISCRVVSISSWSNLFFSRWFNSSSVAIITSMVNQQQGQQPINDWQDWRFGLGIRAHAHRYTRGLGWDIKNKTTKIKTKLKSTTMVLFFSNKVTSSHFWII